jgi:hypothetical protein
MRTLAAWRRFAQRTARVIALAGIVGCASSATDGWTKPAMTEEERGRDTLQCLTEAQNPPHGRDGARVRIDQTRYRRCMAARGYTATPAK